MGWVIPTSTITPSVRCMQRTRISTSSCIRRGFRRRRGSRIGRIAEINKMVEVEVKMDIYAKLGTLRSLSCKRGDNSKNCKSNCCNMVIRGP